MMAKHAGVYTSGSTDDEPNVEHTSTSPVVGAASVNGQHGIALDPHELTVKLPGMASSGANLRCPPRNPRLVELACRYYMPPPSTPSVFHETSGTSGYRNNPDRLHKDSCAVCRVLVPGIWESLKFLLNRMVQQHGVHSCLHSPVETPHMRASESVTGREEFLGSPPECNAFLRSRCPRQLPRHLIKSGTYLCKPLRFIFTLHRLHLRHSYYSRPAPSILLFDPGMPPIQRGGLWRLEAKTRARKKKNA